MTVRDPSPRRSRVWFSRLVGAGAGLTAAVAIVCTPAIGGPAGTEMDDLLRRFRTTEVRADFIIVLDTSGSMARRGNFEAARQGILEFVDALIPGDHVALMAFDERPRNLIVPQEIKADRAALRRSIQEIGAPVGRWTDIGWALDRTLEELNRPGSNRLQFVFFVTDGKHEPGRRTRYPTESGESWHQLSRRAELILPGRLVRVVALKLSESAGVHLVQRIFPDTEEIPTDGRTLGTYFHRLKREVMRERLRLQIGEELRGGAVRVSVAAEGPVRLGAGGSALVTVRLDSTYRWLGVRVTGLTVRATGAEGRFDVALADSVSGGTARRPDVELKPGGSVALRMRLSDRAHPSRLHLRRVETFEVDVAGTGGAEFEFATALRELAIPPAVSLAGQGRLRVEVSSGLSLWIVGLAALGLAAVLGGVWQLIVRPAIRRRLPVPIFGRLAFLQAPVGQPLPAPRVLRGGGEGKTEYRIGSGTSCDLRLPGSLMRSHHATLYSAKPRAMYVRTEGDAELLVSEAGAVRRVYEPVKLWRGVELRAGDYRIVWYDR